MGKVDVVKEDFRECDGCDEMLVVIKCDSCKGWFCTRCFDDHSCVSRTRMGTESFTVGQLKNGDMVVVDEDGLVTNMTKFDPKNPPSIYEKFAIQVSGNGDKIDADDIDRSLRSAFHDVSDLDVQVRKKG